MFQYMFFLGGGWEGRLAIYTHSLLGIFVLIHTVIKSMPNTLTPWFKVMIPYNFNAKSMAMHVLQLNKIKKTSL